jgi:quercetin dioxygenase-like cupin family protein
LAETFERDEPAMHATATVNYAVVLDGEIWLEVDDHQTVHLRRGDVVVQNGTRHGWRNKGSQTATMLFVLLVPTNRAEQICLEFRVALPPPTIAVVEPGHSRV